MNTDCIDLIQFHWWDYNNPSYIDALINLSNIRDDEKIKHIGLTNFNTKQFQIIKDQRLDIVSNQVQFSILDQRPEKLMIPFCKKYNIHLLSYGTLLGGFLSEKYLNSPEPTRADLLTASLQKYYNMINAWGGWELFQELLQILHQISEKHSCTIANVSASFILEKPTVAGVIIGARLGISEHREDNSKAFGLHLDVEDILLINSVTQKSNDLFERIGDCGDEYR
jgi:aryl-alcohol dehydrogenase-like predicted oxidoreductase